MARTRWRTVTDGAGALLGTNDPPEDYNLILSAKRFLANACARTPCILANLELQLHVGQFSLGHQVPDFHKVIEGLIWELVRKPEMGTFFAEVK
jgi:hypothetical protein